MEVLSNPEVDGSVVVAADILEMDRDRARKIVTKALARTLRLPEVNGNIAAAAAKLKLHYQAAYKLCMKNDFIAAQHPSKDPDAMTLTQLDTIARDAVLTTEEIKEIEAVAKIDEKLQVGDFKNLGLSRKRVEHLLTLEKFGQHNMSSMMDLTHGGMLSNFFDLIDLAKTYKAKLDNGELPTEYDEQGNEKNTERDWVQTLVSISGELRQINNQVYRSNVLRLKAKELEQNKTGGVSGKKYPAKPGFGPMVAVQVNSDKDKTEVKINEQG